MITSPALRDAPAAAMVRASHSAALSGLPRHAAPAPSELLTGELTIDQLRAHWANVVKAVNESSKVAGVLLRDSAPLSLSDGILVVAFPNVGVLKNAQSGHLERLAGVAMVEVAGRLVGEHELGPIRQRTRDGHALLLPGGKLERPMVQLVTQPDAFQQRFGKRAICARPKGHSE